MTTHKTSIKLTAGLIALLLVAGVILGILYLMWSMWCWVLPQLFPTGPENLTKPSYWLFVAAWLLVSWIGRAIFGSKK